MGAAGNKKPKKPKDKHHVPAYEKEEISAFLYLCSHENGSKGIF